MNRGARPAAAPRRARFLLAGAVVLGVLGAGGFYLARDVFSPGQADDTTTVGRHAAAAQCGTTAGASCAATPGTAAIAMSSAVVTVPPNKQAASSSSSASAKAPPARPSTTATNSAGTPTPSASAPTSASADTTEGAAPDAAAEAQVLALINQARATAGLPALTVTAGLEASSAAHNSRMAAGCGLSHQCPGEAAIGTRETAAGVDWTACGENIGEGGPVSAAAIAQMAVGLTQSMLDEQPPNDGHRMNILSTAYTRIGIAVDRDSSGTVWLTQDFSN
jgi:uncharacterized protein YkwD